MESNNFNKGFTLIEILMVVLIIGILAAIAMPKYITAVDKAKMARYETMVKSISDARRRLALVKEDWNYNFTELDIDLSGIKGTLPFTQGPSKGTVALFDWGYCYLVEAKKDWSDADVFCGGYDLVGYVHTIQFHSGENTFTPYCVSSKDNPRGIRLCNTYAPTSTWGCFWGPDTELVCQAQASAITK